MVSKPLVLSEIIPDFICCIWCLLFRNWSIRGRSVGKNSGSSVYNIEKSWSRYRYLTSVINSLKLFSTDFALIRDWNYSSVSVSIRLFSPVPCRNILFRWDAFKSSPAVSNIMFSSSNSKVPLLSWSNLSKRTLISCSCIFSFSVSK